METLKEVKMLETMAKHYIISDQCAFELINKLSFGGDDTNFVIILSIYYGVEHFNLLESMKK